MEKDKKYKVTLGNWGANPSTILLSSDSVLTEREAKRYLKDLAKEFRHIPATTCFLCMETQFSKKETTSVSFNRNWKNNKVQKEKILSNSLELHLATCLNCTNTERNCLNNIKEGKCQDKFVIELIGKRFFSTKYTQEKQK